MPLGTNPVAVKKDWGQTTSGVYSLQCFYAVR